MITGNEKLLAAYAANGSESAFRELVSRYVNFVYSTALRLVDGNTQLAEDVTQLVFISLAKKGRVLSEEVMLGGWLHQCTYHLATKAARSERRRQFREREACEMNLLSDPSDAHWQRIAPILDEAITQLGQEDRTAILLRFFEQRDFRSVSQALGSSEDAARMRVNRALEKLHTLLKQRGVTLPVAGLGTMLTAQAVTSAPVALAGTISGVALAPIGGGSPLALLKPMAAMPLKTSLATLAVAGVVTALLVQNRSATRLRGENQALRAQITQANGENGNRQRSGVLSRPPRAPRLPAPQVQSDTQRASAPAEPMPSANLFALLTNKMSKLTAQQIGPYLDDNRHNAASLLAAFRTTGDSTWLEAAMQKFPNDSQVAFEAALRKEASPHERREWLDKLKLSAPQNGLANYLSAADYFRAGATDQAVQELMAAQEKPQLQDYSVERAQNDEEAYRSAGYSVAEAKIAATMQLLLPHLVDLKELSRGMADLARSYRQVNDEGSREAVLQIAANLGQRYGVAGGGSTILSQLVGVAIEREALNAMDPNQVYGDPHNPQTVQDRLKQLAEQRGTLQRLGQYAEPLYSSMSEADWVSYHNRSTAFGEQAALLWLINKYGEKP
jgi:RNA polymerase sigma factor (sigma-70 family)